MKEQKELSMAVIIGAIICLILCVITVENKLAVCVCGIAIGMQIMLLIDILKKRRSDKES